MSDWLEYPKNKPIIEEPVLVVMLTTDNISVVQFAKILSSDDQKDVWQFFETIQRGIITHFMKVPALPLIHHLKNDKIN